MGFLDIIETFEFNDKDHKTLTGSKIPPVNIIQDTECRVMSVEIEGFEYKFNVDWVPKEMKSWLAWIISSHMQECHDRAVKKTKDEIHESLRAFLGSFGAKL